MEFIPYNIVPICILFLGAYLVHLGKPGWGWCLLAAICVTVYPTSRKKDTDNP